jgi:hypothetical protein
MKMRLRFNEDETYPVRENGKGHIIVGKKSSSWLSGYTLNRLLELGKVEKVYNVDVVVDF